MSSLDNLKARLKYRGGAKQEDRMNADKLRSLRDALLNSYQGQTAILTDEREFRCLINHDKLKEDYDDKIISIPYRDICLNAPKEGKKTSDGMQDIGMKVGDIFTWKETNTKWIVIQEILEENAYFRGTIRRAEDEVIIDGKSYYAYLKRPSYHTLWHTKGLNSWSEMGYEVVLYITADDTTRDYFHRFTKVVINDHLWEVQMVDDITSNTMLLIYLKETYINEFDPVDDLNAGIGSDDTEEPVEEPIGVAAINGADSVYPFDTIVYTIENAENGVWFVSNTKAAIVSQTAEQAEVKILATKKGSFDIRYSRENEEDIVKTITINSF